MLVSAIWHVRLFIAFNRKQTVIDYFAGVPCEMDFGLPGLVCLWRPIAVRNKEALSPLRPRLTCFVVTYTRWYPLVASNRQWSYWYGLAGVLVNCVLSGSMASGHAMPTIWESLDFYLSVCVVGLRSCNRCSTLRNCGTEEEDIAGLEVYWSNLGFFE